MTELMIGRDGLVTAITTFLTGQDAGTLATIRRALEQELDAAGPAAIEVLGEHLANAGADWTYYPPDLLARRIHHLVADTLLQRDSTVAGVEHLDTVAGRPVVIVANHLSYSDANLLDVLFARVGGQALSDRLTVAAGPKVYSSLKRRFSSLCFGTIKTPQSSGLASGDAMMSPRDVARAARRTIDAVHERLRLGDALLVFPEGRRSRTRGLQPMLASVTRYLAVPGTWVLPVGIVGSDQMFPIDSDALHPVRIDVRAGRPFEARRLLDAAAGDRQLAMDVIGLAIATVLPREYQGAYAIDGLSDAADLEAARRIFSSWPCA